jgi:hypothetical protein
MRVGSREPITPNEDTVSDVQGLWAHFRANQRRPPVRRLGLISIAGAAVPAAVALGLWLAGEPGDERVGPWAPTLWPIFFLLLALALLLSGLSDLRPPMDHQGISRLRLLSTAMRVLSFAVWGASLLGLFVA